MSADLNILVVDDNEDLAGNLRDILGEIGYRASVALDGTSAVDRCRRETFDVVLLDFNLPDMDGLQVQETLSSIIDADYIIITGYASVDSAATAVTRKRIIAYETKPINMDRLLAFLRQIDDRRRAERELGRSRERYRTLYEAVTDALFVHGLEEDGTMGGFREVNDVACRQYGFSREELLCMSPADIDASESETAVSAVLDTLTRGESATFERIHVRKDGMRLPVEIHARSFELDGKPSVLSLVRDISDRKEAEEERRRMENRLHTIQRQESLGVMAGGIAHDFNNLLMAIIGNLELAEEDADLSTFTRKALSESKAAAFRASDLVRQILAYSGKGHFVVGPIRVNPVVEETARMLRTTIAPRAEIDIRLDPADPVIEGDTGQLRQVVTNLILNAWESLGEKKDGSVVLTTGVEACDAAGLKGTVSEIWVGYEEPLREGPYAFVEVEDNGCGMDDATLARIFEPFFSTKFQGRGLGLASVIGIIRGHRGFVRLESGPGRGTRFRALFPLKEDERMPAEASAPEAPAEPFQGRGRVLVVDDEAPVRGLIRLMLEKLGYEVIVAAGGTEAVDLYRQHSDGIDLILMDLSMPCMGGVEAFGRLRDLGCAVPVILSSGYSEEYLKKEYTGKGFSGFLQKPFLKRTLVEMLTRVMDEKKTRPH